MDQNQVEINLTDLADAIVFDQAAQKWLANHPEMAGEVETAQKVRQLLSELRAVPIQISADFESRLMERLGEDATLLSMLNLGCAGLAAAFLELLGIFFGLFPPSSPVTSVTP